MIQPELKTDLPRDNPLVSVEVLRRPNTYAGNPIKEILFNLNLPDHRFKKRWRYLVPAESSIKVKRTSRTKNNQAFKIKKGMSMSVQISQAQDGERPQDDD
ncbi:hypothetical protein Tco_0836170 [Tanacetum coccineum]